MKKLFVKVALITMSIVFFVGVLLIFNSIEMGENAGYVAL